MESSPRPTSLIVVFLFNALRMDAESSIELPLRSSDVRVEFDLRESLNALAPDAPILFS